MEPIPFMTHEFKKNCFFFGSFESEIFMRLEQSYLKLQLNQGEKMVGGLTL